MQTRDNEILAETAGRLLAGENITIGLAESCTGGMIGAALTSVAGSSQYFIGGIVSYNNSVKENVLGVPADILEEYGAVSEETAGYMAKGARNVLRTDLGLAVTGIAGPDGGSPEKPVGLVYFALCDGRKTKWRRVIFPGPRDEVRRGAVNVALNMVVQYLNDNLISLTDSR